MISLLQFVKSYPGELKETAVSLILREHNIVLAQKGDRKKIKLVTLIKI